MDLLFRFLAVMNTREVFWRNPTVEFPPRWIDQIRAKSPCKIELNLENGAKRPGQFFSGANYTTHLGSLKFWSANFSRKFLKGTPFAEPRVAPLTWDRTWQNLYAGSSVLNDFIYFC